MSTLGILAGLATAVLWTATAICFEAAMRRIGSLSVNVLRLVVAAMLFVGLSLVRTGHLVPQDQPALVWRDLTLSGLVGFVAGDLMLFHSVLLIGARLAMLIYASVPALTAIGGYLFMGERIGAIGILGMTVTTVGIGAAVTRKRGFSPADAAARRLGMVLAVGGSAGQAGGLLLGKHGALRLDAFAATEIRVFAGLVGFLFVAAISKRLLSITSVVGVAFGLLRPRNAEQPRAARFALVTLTCGALLGPFLGVSLGLLSAQLLPAGIASTLMSLVPVLMIPVSAVAFHERITRVEVVGTLAALVGVSLLTLSRKLA